jgi:uncharacterized protein (DUF433 family)
MSILGGIPVLEAGDSVADFMASFPDVRREQITNLLEASKERVLREAECAS